MQCFIPQWNDWSIKFNTVSEYKLGVIDYGLCYYPTPENQNQYQYVDKADNCYTFKAKETECSMFSEQIDIPIQT